jgi:hypothetical protein
MRDHQGFSTTLAKERHLLEMFALSLIWTKIRGR